MLKFQRLLLGFFILLIPIIYPLHDVNGRDFQEQVFRYGVMIVSVFFVRNIWLALFFCWTLFLYYLNAGSVGHDTVLNIYLGIILFGISRTVYTKFKFEKECRWILWVGLISMVFMVLQYFGVDPIHAQMTNDGHILPFQTFRDLSGVFCLKAHNGIFLALLVPICAMIHPALGIAMILPIKFSESSGAVLAAGSSLLFFLWFMKKKKWFYIALALGIFGMGFFFIKDYKASPKMYGSRLNIWHLTIRQSLLRPLGYGPDSFRNITPYKDFMIMGDQDFHSAIGLTTKDPNSFQFIYYNPDHGKMQEINDYSKGYQLKSPNIWDHPHNEYLNLLFCFGFVGVVIFCFFAREEVIAFINSEKTIEVVLLASMILVYATSSLVQFPLCVARLGYLFPVLLGAYTAATRPN